MTDYHIGILIGVAAGAIGEAAVSLLTVAFFNGMSGRRYPSKGRIENWSSRREAWNRKEKQ
jgi:hypothetical protein